MFALLCTQCAYAEQNMTYSVVLYHQANPPYSFVEDEIRKGIFVDIFNEISLLTDLKFEFVSLSVARGKRYFEQGKIDIEPGISPEWRKGESIEGVYSMNYATSKEVIISEKTTSITDVSQLYGEVVGKVRGYSYGEFDEHFSPEKIIVADNTSEKMLVAQLHKHRFNYVIIGGATAAYYISSVEKYQNFNEVYEVSNYPVAMRVHPQHEAIVPILNDALSVLIHTGKIVDIYAKYGSRQEGFH